MDQAVQCKVCGVYTHNKGTKLCDCCWEINHRIKYLNKTATSYFIIEMEKHLLKLSEIKEKIR